MKVGEFYSRRLVLLALTLLVACVGFAIDTNGQGARQPNNIARRLDDFNNQSVKAERDEMNKELRGKKPSAEELKRVAALKAQLKEDLESLQEAYNTLVTKLKASEPMPPKLAAEVGERVHLRSERLLKNLNLPAPKSPDTGETKSYTGDTNTLLRSMCSLLFKFITDPMFESPSAIDVESGAKARLTLEELIRLSDHIRHRS
jgi:hypothetical protein